MDVIDEIRSFLIEEKLMDSDATLTETDSLLEEGVIDSLGIQTLVSFIESQYGITVDEDDLMPDNFDSLFAIKEYIDEKRNG